MIIANRKRPTNCAYKADPMWVLENGYGLWSCGYRPIVKLARLRPIQIWNLLEKCCIYILAS